MGDTRTKEPRAWQGQTRDSQRPFSSKAPSLSFLFLVSPFAQCRLTPWSCLQAARAARRPATALPPGAPARQYAGLGEGAGTATHLLAAKLACEGLDLGERNLAVAVAIQTFGWPTPPPARSQTVRTGLQGRSHRGRGKRTAHERGDLGRVGRTVLDGVEGALQVGDRDRALRVWVDQLEARAQIILDLHIHRQGARRGFRGTPPHPIGGGVAEQSQPTLASSPSRLPMSWSTLRPRRADARDSSTAPLAVSLSASTSCTPATTPVA